MSIKTWYEYQKYLADKSTLQIPADREMEKRRTEAIRLLPLKDKKAQLQEQRNKAVDAAEII